MGNDRAPHQLRLIFTLIIIFSILLACNLLDRQENNSNNQNQANNQQNQDQDQQDQNQNQQDQTNQDANNDDDGNMVQGHTGVWESLNYGGYGFRYDPAVIEDIQPTTVTQSAGGMYEMPHPPYVRYDLLLDSGSISVVDFTWLLDVSAKANETYPELEDLLDTQNFQGFTCLPEIPLGSYYEQCGHQQYHANVAFIDFANGSGMRFVTTYGLQDTVAVSNETIEYVFQGFTDDGLCFVKATFRLTHEDLEDFAVVPDDVYADSSGQLLRQYFAEFRDILESNPDGYLPGLERFDMIIQSIEVDYCTSG
jgi:hypothetical protein